MSIQWIRDSYQVPAKVRGRVRYTPDGSKGAAYLGTIAGTRGQYLLIRLDHQVESAAYHPTWEIEYLPRPPITH